MTCIRLIPHWLAAIGLLLSHEAFGWEPDPVEFLDIAGPAAPPARLALSRGDGLLRLVLELEPEAGDSVEAPAVHLGVAAARRVMLHANGLAVHRRASVLRYRFEAPEDSLVENPGDWRRLRVALAVTWPGGPFGEDRRRERYRHLRGAPHEALSPAPDEWQPWVLDEYEALVADRRRSIAIPLQQPFDGKATIVIEDSHGTRIRNLVAGVRLPAGRQAVPWDGLDERGNVVPPGHYQWRAACHPGITPEYLFSFCNDGDPPWRTGTGTDLWGPDHSCIVAATAGEEWTFLGGPVAESGYGIVAVDRDGVKRMHYNAPHGTGLWAIALAADDRYLYCAKDGMAWGQKVDRSNPNWSAEIRLNLMRFDIAGGKLVPYGDGKMFVTLSAMHIGPGSDRPEWEGPALGGMAMVDGTLYISNRAADEVVLVDPATAEVRESFSVKAPEAIAGRGDRLLVVSANAVLDVDLRGRQQQTLIGPGILEPQGIAIDAGGNVYISDGQTHTIRTFQADGRPLGKLGKPGGEYAGPYDPQRLVNPRGIAVAANGWLWATEDRRNPKRVSAWDPATGNVVIEKFGPTPYGAPGAGFDPLDPKRWIGLGAVWSLDFGRRQARPVSILTEQLGHFGGYGETRHYRFVRRDGRTFLIGQGKATTISELRDDGSLHDLVAVAGCHTFSYFCRWNPPPAYIEAFHRAYPDVRRDPSPTSRAPYAQRGRGVLWVDRNGDGLCQADEFQFTPAEVDEFNGSNWGHGLADLTIRFPAKIDNRTVLVVLEPDGYLPSGAPRYPPLAEAVATAMPIPLRPGYEQHGASTTVDSRGNVLFNSRDEMTCFAPDGSLLWTFPNRWSNVHGSHAAPLPEVGVMQGTLFFLGTAPLDEQGDATVLNGNHGRFFVMTTDGFYLDEMFKDVRMGGELDAHYIGGECFGGFFGRSQCEGDYYLQSGHTDYRIFRLHGLDRVQRQQGTLEVTVEQALASANNQVRRAAGESVLREAGIPYLAAPPTIDGRLDDWRDVEPIAWDRSGKFPASVRAAYDDENLYLLYEVQDDSPWINRGKNWSTLFKTGDSVDLQLATDPTADPKRRAPAPGDLRLLVAPYEDGNIAVLYRHRVPGTTDPVDFESPWRSERVDVVERLDDVPIAVERRGDGYAVELSVPLARLGMKRPGEKRLNADFGVLYGDPSGVTTSLRSYWSNTATGIVNDVPSEIMLQPNLWGTVRFEGGDK